MTEQKEREKKKVGRSKDGILALLSSSQQSVHVDKHLKVQKVYYKEKDRFYSKVFKWTSTSKCRTHITKIKIGFTAKYVFGQTPHSEKCISQNFFKYSSEKSVLSISKLSI